MDEGTYWSRVRRMAAMMDVRKIFITPSQVDRALATIKMYQDSPQSVPETEYLRSVRIKEAVIHPDTGQPIPLPLRVSFILPANLLLDFFMIKAQSYGLVAGVLAQFTNQTYNICHYYANRNASNDSAQTMQTMWASYAGSVVASVSTCMALTEAVNRMSARLSNSASLFSPPMLLLARRFVPFFAVAAADVLNLRIIRGNEITQGVDIRKENGELVGKSKVAGQQAVRECIIGRVIAAAPILLVPPVVMHRIEQTSWFMKRPRLGTPIMMGLIGLMLQVNVPLFFGLFRQGASRLVTQLEPEFHALRDDNRQPLRVYYNKGI